MRKLSWILTGWPNYISSIKDEISEEQLKLKRVSDLIAAYEKIVEGNYIDNLIREQSEQELTKTGEKRTWFKPFVVQKHLTNHIKYDKILMYNMKGRWMIWKQPQTVAGIYHSHLCA